MRQTKIDGLDDQATAAAAPEALAYQAPTHANPTAEQLSAVPADNGVPGLDSDGQPLATDAPSLPAGEGDVSSVVAWQAAIEQLLQLIGPDAVSGALGAVEAVAPSSLLMPSEPPPSGEASAILPSEGIPGALYSIESLSSGSPPVLSLDENDLFGNVGTDTINLLSTDSGDPPPLFKGMELDLFGPMQQDTHIKFASDNGNGVQGPTIGPVGPPPTPPGGDGYISLLDGPEDLKLTVDYAKILASPSGTLFVEGDGNDHLYLSGDWILVGAAGKGAVLYTDSMGTIDLTVHNTEVVIV